MVLPIFIGVFLFLILGSMPVAVAMLGSSAVLLLFLKPDDLMTVVHRMVTSVDSFPFVAIPLFLLVGELMSRSGLTERLVNLALALVGRMPGGLAQVTVLTNMFMAGISGSASADAAATGSLLIPAMIKKGYPRPFAAAILAGAATIGPVIPPSIPMVVYGAMANVSVGRLFIGGIVPGVVMGSFLMATAYVAAKRYGFGAAEAPMSCGAMLQALRGAAFPMLIPIIIIGGILGGVFTATESADAAVVTILLIGALAFRQLKLRDIVDSLRGSVRVLGPIMLVISGASVFGLLLTQERAGELLAGLLTAISDEPVVVLATFCFLVLILGMFMEAIAVLILLTPVVAPMAPALGIDPVHFGMAFNVALMIGLITPPVGITMYIGLSIAKISMEDFARAFWPYLLALMVALALIIVFPQLVLFLPNLLMPAR